MPASKKQKENERLAKVYSLAVLIRLGRRKGGRALTPKALDLTALSTPLKNKKCLNRKIEQ
jgi:hypothetical protein